MLALAAAVSIVSVPRMEGWFHELHPIPFAPSNFGPLIATLDSLGLDRVYADYWIAYRLTFATRERIVAVENQFDAVSFHHGQAELPPDPNVRYRPYEREVAAAPHGFVFFQRTVGSVPIVAQLVRARLPAPPRRPVRRLRAGAHGRLSPLPERRHNARGGSQGRRPARRSWPASRDGWQPARPAPRAGSRRLLLRAAGRGRRPQRVGEARCRAAPLQVRRPPKPHLGLGVRARAHPRPAPFQSTCDPDNRPADYPGILLLPAHLGLGPGDTIALGWSLFAVYLAAAVAVIPARARSSTTALYALALCSPAAMLGVERGNIRPDAVQPDRARGARRPTRAARAGALARRSCCSPE